MSRLRIDLEGITLPAEIIQDVQISFGLNTLGVARLSIGGDVFYSGVFSDEKAYEKLSAILLKGYPDIKIYFDGNLLFEGIVTRISFSRSSQDSAIFMDCISNFYLLNIAKVFLRNITSVDQIGQTLANGAVYPVLQDLGTENALLIKKLIEISEFINKKEFRDKDPIKEIAKKIFSIYDYTPEDYAIKTWLDEVKKVYQFEDRIDSFVPNSRHIFRFLLDYMKNIHIFYQYLTGMALREGFKIEDLFSMFLKFVNLFQLYIVELPTTKGTSIIVKPMMLFHKPPKCNVIPSHQLISFSVSEDTGAEKPTRIYVRLSDMTTNLIGQASTLLLGEILVSNTVVAPEELEKIRLIRLAEDAGIGSYEELKNKDIDEIAQLVFKNISVFGTNPRITLNLNKETTEEEKKRGIIPDFYDVPPALSESLKSLPSYNAWLLLKELALNHFYFMRGQYSQASITLVFNPFLIPGHTVIFSDGLHKYFGFASTVTHNITPSGAYSSVSLINFSRIDHSEDRDPFTEYISPFELVEDGDYMTTWNDEFLNRYYQELFGTELATLETVDEIEKLKEKELEELMIRTYNDFWYRPLYNKYKKSKIDPQIQEMVINFVSSIVRGSQF